MDSVDNSYHLGNPLLVFNNNGSGGIQILQENSFYAFGKTMPNSTVSLPSLPNINLYNGGSEWQNTFNDLPDYYQTYFRNYDPAIGRFIGVDPKAETSDEMTTYNYTGNNPIMFNDPLGDQRYIPLERFSGDGLATFGNMDYAGERWRSIMDKAGAMMDAMHAAQNRNDVAAFWNSIENIVSGDRIGEGLTDLNINFKGNNSYSYTYQTSYVNYAENYAGVTNHTVNVDGGKANQRGTTHAQELDKYGQISWGYNFTIGASAGPIGGMAEIGTLVTNKGWARDYKTFYAAPGFVSPSASHSFFFVYSTDSKNLPTFGDWNGLSKGLSVSFDFVAVGGGLGSNYSVWSLGLSAAPASLNFMKDANVIKGVQGTGSINVGVTTWLGPYYMLPGNGATQRYINTMKFQGGY